MIKIPLMILVMVMVMVWRNTMRTNLASISGPGRAKVCKKKEVVQYIRWYIAPGRILYNVPGNDVVKIMHMCMKHLSVSYSHFDQS